VTSKVYLADNLSVLSSIGDESVDLVYIDPPFNTGKTRKKKKEKFTRVWGRGDRQGFGGNQYLVEALGESLSYGDSFDDFLGFLHTRLVEIYRVLKPSGCLYLHLDYREAPYARILGDAIFGRDHFLNEIIWAYDYGGKPKTRWPAKHDNILFWVKDLKNYYWNDEEVARIPYMAPGMVTPEKAARGKKVTDTWWHTIVPTNGKEKTGYPTQKPLGVIERIVRASSPPGGLVLDCFAGSGTTGEAAAKLGRDFILVDNNPEAVAVMKKRLRPYSTRENPIRFINRMRAKKEVA
jgi:site-specific DNA-methyltransferase (adenine-specific)